MIPPRRTARYDLPLFVPANKPDRYAKALSVAYDAVIIDLEDAVAAPDKPGARDALADQAGLLSDTGKSVFVRVNARATTWHKDDLAVCAGLPLTGVMLPKSETADDLEALDHALPQDMLRLALVETVRGVVNAPDIATVATRLVFGSVDFCADLGCDHDRLALLRPRQDLVIASRLAGLPAPLDGVTTALRDDDLIRSDAAHALMLGFGGKLLIHPAQIEPARQGFAPTEAQLNWAKTVLAASDGQAASVDGMMVDAPVLARARAIQARARRDDER